MITRNTCINSASETLSLVVRNDCTTLTSRCGRAKSEKRTMLLIRVYIRGVEGQHCGITVDEDIVEK